MKKKIRDKFVITTKTTLKCKFFSIMVHYERSEQIPTNELGLDYTRLCICNVMEN